MRCIKKDVKDNGNHKVFDQVKRLQNQLNSTIEVINKNTSSVHITEVGRSNNQYKILLVKFEDVFE